MGFRTVVVLSNDEAHLWAHDAALGSKIMASSLDARPDSGLGSYGEVIEQVHADTQSLIIADGYSAVVVAGGKWYRGQTEDDSKLELLKKFASELGYSLRRTVKVNFKAC